MCDNKCCCCCSIKSGTLINLWITTMLWGILEINVIREIFIHCLLSSADSTNGQVRTDSKVPKMFDSWPMASILSSAFCTYSIILAMAISGLFAVSKKKSILLIPYFVYRVVWVVFYSILLLTLVFATGSLPQLLSFVNIDLAHEALEFITRMAEELITSVIVVVLLILAFESHCTYVVYQCYRQLENEEEKEKNAIPMNATWSAATETNVRLAEKSLNCQQQQC